MKTFKTFSIGILLVLSCAKAYAQGSVTITHEFFEQVEVVKEDGTKEVKLVKAASIVPKDIIVYISTFENVGQEPAENIVINIPVPNDSVYIAGSAKGDDTTTTFSVDGGKTYGSIASLRVKTAEGGTRIARPEEYTHIRWVYGTALPPGKKSTVSYSTMIK